MLHSIFNKEEKNKSFVNLKEKLFYNSMQILQTCHSIRGDTEKHPLFTCQKAKNERQSVISLSHNYSLLWQKLNNFCNIEMVIKVCRVSQQL